MHSARVPTTTYQLSNYSPNNSRSRMHRHNTAVPKYFSQTKLLLPHGLLFSLTKIFYRCYLCYYKLTRFWFTIFSSNKSFLQVLLTYKLTTFRFSTFFSLTKIFYGCYLYYYFNYTNYLLTKIKYTTREKKVENQNIVNLYVSSSGRKL